MVGDAPAYLSFDIDALDPAFAPGTGTPEIGGLASWQAQAILRRLAASRFAGMDVVEVAPAYDVAEITALAAATIAWEYLALVGLSAMPVATDAPPRIASPARIACLLRSIGPICPVPLHLCDGRLLTQSHVPRAPSCPGAQQRRNASFSVRAGPPRGAGSLRETPMFADRFARCEVLARIV